MISEPKISVIIPVKNGENYLQEAIDGIKKQNLFMEIIVVDDGSNDNTSRIAENSGCIIIKNEISKGPVVAKNMAIEKAKGEYILFHDHDDIMRGGVLLKMYDEIEKDSSIHAVMAKVQDFISPEISEFDKQKTRIKPEPYYGLFTGAILMKKEIFDIIGLFNESVTAGEIIDWQTKMEANNLKIKKLDLISTDRRIHTQNFGKTNQQQEFKDYAKLLRAKIKK